MGDIFRIMGGARLSGRAVIPAAKNAVLPIMAAAVMTGDCVTLHGCPALDDVGNMAKILEELGCETRAAAGRLTIDGKNARRHEMPDLLSKRLRSSIFMMGPLITRFGRATVTYPGGCEIGLRPIDLHLKGLRRLGVDIREEHGRIYCDGRHRHAGDVLLDFPSVGATENLMMAAVLTKGETIIRNAAREPEIVDLQGFINAMGGRVSGAGSSIVRIRGVDSLHGAAYQPIADRITAGTLLTAAAMTGGEIALDGFSGDSMDAVLAKLREAGCLIDERGGGLTLSAPGRLRAVDVFTQPYPGFPTDMQAQMMALCCVAEGTSIIVENVFESRFSHAAQLVRMGADITVHHRTAVVRGGRLTGARVTARDLRAGAALVLAALAADGMTEVENISLIDRGYERLEETLTALGARIRRV